jgi:hypothetical protein
VQGRLHYKDELPADLAELEGSYLFMLKNEEEEGFERSEEGSARSKINRGTPAFVFHKDSYRPVGVALSERFLSAEGTDDDKKHPGLNRSMVFITPRKTLDKAIDQAQAVGQTHRPTPPEEKIGPFDKARPVPPREQ